MNRIVMRFPRGKSKALTLSYDDGVEQDIHLLELLEQYQVKATFNLNSGLYPPEGTVYPQGTIHRRMPKSRVSELYRSSLAEVAAHAATHPFLDKLPPSQAMREILNDRTALEEQFGCLVRGFAYPYGTYNDEVVEMLREAGICYARTVHSHHSFALPKDWLRLGATCHHDDPKLMELARQFVSESSDRDPWLFYLWGHSYEFEAHDNWKVIEEFLDCVSGKKDIWYATNIEVYDYVKAYERLIFSVDGEMVQNPTAVPVWIAVYSVAGEEACKVFCITPGDTVKLSF